MKSHQHGGSTSMTYGRPVQALAVTQAPASRICETPGCSTKLSRYNPVGTCGRHGGWGPARPGAKSRR